MHVLGPLNPAQVIAAIGRVVRAARARAAADHETIRLRQVRFAPQVMVRYYLYLAVAPSRRSIRPWDDAQVDRARRFAQIIATDSWTAEPLNADVNVTLFGQRGGDGNYERALYVGRDGLIELLWSLSPGADGARALDVEEIADVTAVLAQAVDSREYSELIRRGRLPRPIRRVDWLSAVSTAIPDADGQREWRALRFPGEAPPRASQARAHMPVVPYGHESLRSVRRAHGPDRVPPTLLRELVTANGYYAADQVVEPVAAAAARRARSRAVLRKST